MHTEVSASRPPGNGSRRGMRVLMVVLSLMSCSDTTSGWTQTLDVDFRHVVRESGPYMFGGAHIPPASQPGALQALRDAGVTHIRFDISLEDIVPKNITLSEYIANPAGVADPANWNWKLESEIRRVRDAGLSAYGILLWNPKWLTGNGNDNGEVLDYNVWEDIVRKVLMRLGPSFEYIEIWNEPCWRTFLDLGTSSPEEKVKQVTLEYHRRALHAAEGLGLKLGGPACYGWWRDVLIEALLKDEYIRSHLGFVSWHHYDKDHVDYADIERTAKLVRERAGRDIEMHVTEWNYTADSGSFPEYQNSPKAAAWVARKLIEFYHTGVDSATMYHLSNGPWGYDYAKNNGKWGGYEWRNGVAEPYGFLSVFDMFGKTLGLAQKDAHVEVVETTPLNLPPRVNGIGLTSGAQSNLILLANHGSELPATLLIRATPPVASATAPVVQTFSASGDGTVMEGAVAIEGVEAKSDHAEIRIEIPAYTAIGLRLDWNNALSQTAVRRSR